MSFKVLEQEKLDRNGSQLVKLKVDSEFFDRPRWFNFQPYQMTDGRWKKIVRKAIEETESDKAESVGDLRGEYE